MDLNQNPQIIKNNLISSLTLIGGYCMLSNLKLNLLFLCILSFSPIKVYASNWELIGNGVDNVTYYIDRESITQSDDARFEFSFWYKSISVDKENNTTELKIQALMSCKKKIYAKLFMVRTKNEISAEYKSFPTISIIPIIPDSIIEAIYQKMCI